MKTKDVIKRLQEVDPSGELDVSVGNIDIHFIDVEPGYYDGIQQVLIRDETCRYYNIVGGKFNSSQNKVVIHTHAISDFLFENPDGYVDYSGLPEYNKQSYKESLDKVREFSRDSSYKLELEYFQKHIRQRAAELSSELDDIDYYAKKFFDENLKYTDKIPEDIPFLGDSYVGRRNKQWMREVKIEHTGLQFILTLRRNDMDRARRFAGISDVALDSVYKYGLAKPGTFGYEANIVGTIEVLYLLDKGITDIELLAAASHNGWGDVARTYDDPVYLSNPAKKEKRLQLASTTYANLSEDEKEKDRVAVRALLQEYQK